MVVISCEYYILSAWACLVNFKDESVTPSLKTETHVGINCPKVMR